MNELPPWPRRFFDLVADVASDLLPDRASLDCSPPTEANPYWHIALIPANEAASALHLFITPTGAGQDNFEVGSRAASYELWEEPPEQRLVLLREIIEAIVAGRCSEEVGYTKIKLHLDLRDGPVTYSCVARPPEPRRSEWRSTPQRVDAFR